MALTSDVHPTTPESSEAQMLVWILLNAFTVLLISIFIARFSRLADPRQSLQRYLFGGNTYQLAASSNVGSLLSIAIVFDVYFVGLLGYGLVTIFCLSFGIAVAYIALYLGIRRIVSRKDYYQTKYEYTTLVDIIATEGSRAHVSITFLFIAQYLIVMVLEFGVLNSFVTLLFPDLPTPLIVTAPIGILCATYTSSGGYSGVLRTDLFQVIVFVFGSFYLAFYAALPATLEVVTREFRIENVAPLPWIPPTTFVLMTAAGFCAFPDVWIRNVSTMNLPRAAKLRWLNGSVVCLIASVIPLTILGTYPLLDSTNVDLIYDVPRTHSTFVELFAHSKLLKTDPIALWFVISAMICAFVTTVDTWLIGIMQHLASVVRVRREDVVIVSPYVMVLVGAIGATALHGKLFLAIGLYVWPYLFFNTLFFIIEVFPSVKCVVLPWHVILCLAVGFFITTVMVATNWSQEQLERIPDSVILLSAIGIYTTFAVINCSLRLVEFLRRSPG